MCIICVACENKGNDYNYKIEGFDINNISEDEQYDINLLGKILDKTYENLYFGLKKLNDASEEEYKFKYNGDKIPHSLSEIDMKQLQDFYELINGLRTDKK